MWVWFEHFWWTVLFIFAKKRVYLRGCECSYALTLYDPFNKFVGLKSRAILIEWLRLKIDMNYFSSCRQKLKKSMLSINWISLINTSWQVVTGETWKVV